MTAILTFIIGILIGFFGKDKIKELWDEYVNKKGK